MADPDLQIREGPGHPDHEISRWGGGGGGGGPKNFFQSFVQQFSVTIRGRAQAPPLDLPLDSQYMYIFKTGSTKGTNGN